jgi:hypothetical protein
MPGLTFTLSEYPFNWIELACDRCNRRGRLRKAGLVKLHGADCGVARLREILIADCPRVGNWHGPCRAYYFGLTTGGRSSSELCRSALREISCRRAGNQFRHCK